jgi:23S rRNA (cytidine1920-2'-O)/16S rRNA (cytidine1409-2'-O)-methyltransferase
LSKERLDLLLFDKGLAESRSLAQRLIMAGQVRVDRQVIIKPATQVSTEAIITIDQGPKYVSRGGEKLEAALAAFHLDVSGRTCADVGASTGGFTDCLLQHGAARVYAIDVGAGILGWKLRNDPRVIVMEGTNARYVDNLPEQVNTITIDASFISLKILLPVVRRWLCSYGEIVALIKPQFEAGKKEVTRGKGVIRDPEIHRQVIMDIIGFAHMQDLGLQGLIRSPILGPKGNVEFLAWLQREKDPIKNMLEIIQYTLQSKTQ